MESVGDILNRPGWKNAIPGLKIPEYTNDEGPDRTSPEYIKKALDLPTLENTFASFKKRKGAETSLEAFKAMAEETNQVPFLFCYGSYGNGKTHLVEATILRLWQRGSRCPYETFADLGKRIKKGMRPDAVLKVDDIIENISKRRRLIIDDFGGMGTDTKWAVGCLELIIDYRYRYKLWTIITMNLDWKELEALSGRVASRLSDPSVCKMVLNEASDYRRTLKAEK